MADISTQLGDAEIPRTSYLGGPDIAAILGKSPYRTPFEVWQNKTGRGTPFEPTERMQWGLLLEPVVLDEYCRRNGMRWRPGGFKLHDAKDFQGRRFIGGHADAICVELGTDDESATPATAANPTGFRLLEVKTAAASQRSTWDKGIPIEHQIQAQLYLLLHGLELCTFVVLFGGQELSTYDMEADPIMQHQIIAAGAEFWDLYVVKDIPPPPRVPGWDERSEAVDGSCIEGDNDVREALLELIRLRDARASIEAQEVSLSLYLQDRCPKGSSLAIQGKLVAQWQTKTRKETVLPAQTWTQFTLKPSTVLRKVLSNSESSI